jgi:iron complex transport system substrate-binding protein
MESTVGKPLERLSIPVIYVDFETPDQYERDLRVLGRVFEQPERAEELARYYREGVLRVRTAVSGLPREGKPRVLLLYYSETRGSGAFNIPPASWIQTGMVAMAGGTPVWTEANPGKGWAQVSVEQVYAWDPDVIFVTAYTMRSDEVVRRLRADRNWQPVRALAGRRLYAFPGDFYSWDQPDARWLLGLAWMAARLHPDRFRDWDMMALARDFYRRVFARDDVFFETFVVPVLRGDLH